MRQRGGHLAHRGQSRHVDELGLQLLQPRLRRLTLGYVADKAGEKGPVSRSHFSDCQLHRERRAVLALADREPSDSNDSPFSGPPVSLDVAIVILAVWRGHQQVDILSYQLCRAIAELPLGRRAERLDDSALVDHDHCIWHGLKDRREMGLTRERLARAGRSLNPVAL